MTEKDVFIIHSKAEEHEARLADWVEDSLWHWGMSTYGYGDFEWEIRGRNTYSSRGNKIDPVRIMTKHPEPFIRSGRMGVNTRWLEGMFDRVHAVVVINHGSTPGTQEELAIVDRWLPPTVELKQPGDQQYGRYGHIAVALDPVKASRDDARVLAAHAWTVAAASQLARATGLPGQWLAQRIAAESPWFYRLMAAHQILRGGELDSAMDLDQIIVRSGAHGREVAQWYENYAYVFDEVREVMRTAERPSPVWLLPPLLDRFVSSEAGNYVRSDVDWLTRSSREARVGKWRYSAASAARVGKDPEAAVYWVAKLRHAVGCHWYGRQWDTDYEIRAAAQGYEEIIDLGRGGREEDVARLFYVLLSKESGDFKAARRIFDPLTKSAHRPRIRIEAILRLAEIASLSDEPELASDLIDRADRGLDEAPWGFDHDDEEWDPRPAVLVRRYDDLLRASEILDDQKTRCLLAWARMRQSDGRADEARADLEEAFSRTLRSDKLREELRAELHKS